MGEEKHALGFSKLASFSLAFGCIIGWGCFVVPGTTFLPKAGVVGMDHAFFQFGRCFLPIFPCFGRMPPRLYPWWKLDESWDYYFHEIIEDYNISDLEIREVVSALACCC